MREAVALANNPAPYDIEDFATRRPGKRKPGLMQFFANCTRSGSPILSLRSYSRFVGKPMPFHSTQHLPIDVLPPLTPCSQKIQHIRHGYKPTR